MPVTTRNGLDRASIIQQVFDKLLYSLSIPPDPIKKLNHPFDKMLDLPMFDGLESKAKGFIIKFKAYMLDRDVDHLRFKRDTDRSRGATCFSRCLAVFVNCDQVHW